MKKYFKYVIICICCVILALIIYKYRHCFVYYFNLLKDKQALKHFFNALGPIKSILVFLFLQIIQVVIFFIPGQAIEVIGGYVFGIVLGTILTTIGITIGSTLLFYICRKINNNSRLIQYIMKNSLNTKLKKILTGDKINIIILILYLLPGMPKDNLIYLCALTTISLKDFVIYSVIGRIPAIILTSAIGAQLGCGNITRVAIFTVIISLLLVLCLLKREVLLKKISKVSI